MKTWSLRMSWFQNFLPQISEERMVETYNAKNGGSKHKIQSGNSGLRKDTFEIAT